MAVVTTSSVFTHQFYRTLILEPLFHKSAVLRTIRRIETSATTAYLPRVTGGSVSWVQEAAEIPDSGAVVDLVAVTPKKVAALAIVSNEAVDDANAAEMLGDALAAAVAVKVDAAFFTGGGTFGPAGLPGIAFTPIDADPSSGLDPYIDAIGALEAAGGSASICYMSPATWAALSKLKENVDSARPVLADPVIGPAGTMLRSLAGLPVEITSACPDAEAWVVDGSRVAAVVSLEGEVKSDQSAKFTSDSTVVRVITRVNFGTPYPAGTVAKIAVVGP